MVPSSAAMVRATPLTVMAWLAAKPSSAQLRPSWRTMRSFTASCAGGPASAGLPAKNWKVWATRVASMLLSASPPVPKVSVLPLTDSTV